MKNSQYSILGKKRFLPLFITQFFGAFNDNLFKNALIVLITFKVASSTVLGIPKEIMVTIAPGLFILPYLLFSSFAGQMSDKFERSKLIRRTKILEIIIMVGSIWGFIYNSPILLLVLLFLMGTQSTFFGPSKYSIIPDHLKENEIVAGNGLLDGGTFLAILTGTIVGGILINTDNGEYWVVGTAIVIAVLGYISSWFIPKAQIADPTIKINPNIFAESWNIVKTAKQNRAVFLSILGTSWFWLVGFVFLSQFANYAKVILNADNSVYTLFLTVFSLGIAIGSALCGKIQKGEITAKFVPIAAGGLSIFIFMLVGLSGLSVVSDSASIITITKFIEQPQNWGILFSLFMIALCGGLYSVPLKSIMQTKAEPSQRSRVMAAENIINALFMVAAAIISALLLFIGFDILDLFLIIAISNIFVAIYISTILPDVLLKTALRWVLRRLYKVEVNGMENYEKAGDRVLIIANHQSFLDPTLLAAFLPDKPAFAMNTFVAERWYLRPLLNMFEIFRIDPTQPFSTKSLIKFVKEDKKVVLFPEGRITTTGNLMKVYDGAGMIVDKSDATILPIRIEGAEFSKLSRMQGKFKLRLFPKIKITVLPPTKLNINPELKGGARRTAGGRELYNLMSDMMFKTSNYECSLLEGLVEAMDKYGAKNEVAIDINRKPLSYSGLLTKAFVLGGEFNKKASGENVGILLPNSLACLVSFFALQVAGKVPAMLNFSTGIKNLISACEIAKIETIITSHKFVEMANLQDTIDNLGKKVIYLEDLNISLFAKISGLIKAKRRKIPQIDYNSPAVILYTSGSEGVPKGVVLSHKNIMANVQQAKAKIDLTPQDTALNALPMFHSFGLSMGTLLTLFSGVKTFLYPTPLHYSIIPELCYDQNVTLILGTDTFFKGYARKANPYDFYSIRYAIGGAEKIKDETRATWFNKFGVRITEGYGATEASPLISFNNAMEFKLGTVGQFISGIEHKLEKTEAGNKLLIKGPNLMLGYLKADNPGVLRPLNDWYDTGDIVEVDDEGYLKIVGRAKRFAKIGGEMVSLIAVEEFVLSVWKDYVHAIMAKPDEKKGEQLVLVTEYAEHSISELRAKAKEAGFSELFLPKDIVYMRKIPMLGSGKVDYVGLNEEL